VCVCVVRARMRACACVHVCMCGMCVCMVCVHVCVLFVCASVCVCTIVCMFPCMCVCASVCCVKVHVQLLKASSTNHKISTSVNFPPYLAQPCEKKAGLLHESSLLWGIRFHRQTYFDYTCILTQGRSCISAVSMSSFVVQKGRASIFIGKSKSFQCTMFAKILSLMTLSNITN